MGLTIAEHAKALRNKFESGVVKSWLEAVPVLDVIQTHQQEGFVAKWTREQTLPAVGHRSLNEPWTESTGTVEQLSTQIELLGGKITIDKEFIDDPTMWDEAALQIDMKSRSIAYTLADDIINGDLAVDPEGMDGLKIITASLPSRQVIDAGGLDLTTGAMREAKADDLLFYFAQAIQRIEAGTGGKPDLALMNDTMKLYLTDAARRKNRFATAKDSFDREIDQVNGVKLYDAGYKADQTTKIIPDNVTGGYTDIYFVRTGDRFTRILQKYALRVSPRRLLDDMVTYAWTVETTAGLQVRDKFSVLRLKGLDVTP